MYYLIHQLLYKLVTALGNLPNSIMVRSILAWVPVLLYYVIPLLFVISAINSYKVRRQFVSTKWLKFILIVFCIDGFLYTLFVYHSPSAKYPFILILLEVIVFIALLILLLANCDKKYAESLRGFVDAFFVGFGFSLLTNLCIAMWSWGIEAVWLKVLAVIIFLIGLIKVLRM